MLGKRDDAGPREKQAFKNFKYYKELSTEAFRYFSTHFRNSEYFGFATSAYEQWFASLRLGLYSAPDLVLSGVGNLNLPELNPRTTGSGEQHSPRLEALKKYLKVIYKLRIRCQLLDLLVRQAPKTGNSANVSSEV